MPKYEPEKWNDLKTGGNKQKYSNCYDYATNMPRDTEVNPYKPDERIPGTRGKKPIPKETRYTCELLIDGAEADGLDFGKKGGSPITKDSKCPDGCWKVVLLITKPEYPDVDFHFLRQDDNGEWSHKRSAGMPAENTDWSGNVIKDPERANLDKYRICDPNGYGCVCPDKLVSFFLPPVEGRTFAVIKLNAPATLVSTNMALELPAGRLGLVYEEPVLGRSTVTAQALLYTGSPNPSHEFSDEELDMLRTKLRDLPESKKPLPKGRNYNGFFVDNPVGIAGIPKSVRVFQGAIETSDGPCTQYEDVNQLEAWLLEKSKSLWFGYDIAQAIETAG